MKTVWKFAGFTLILIISSFIAFPLFVYLGKGKETPYAYEFLGALASAGIMLVAAVFGCATLGVWLSQRNKIINLFEDSHL